MTLAQEGEIIAGRYRLEGILGRGGMGAVYEATQLGLNRRVAIKLMLPELGLQAEARARFEREARVTAALRHPHTVEIYDFGEDQGRLYLVMERLQGVPLSALMGPTRPPLALPRTVEIARQVADALSAAHALPLVHRDLKPENLFLEQTDQGEDRVVVVDFGLAFIAERDDTGRVTKENLIMGTPLYISPEQISMKDVGPWSDIYTFGCILYEMVCGVPPFDGSPMMLLSKHTFQSPVPPSQRNPDVYVPRALENLVLAMQSKAPAARPSAVSVRAALEQLDAALGDRERSRTHSHLMERSARMIEAPSAPPIAPEGADDQHVVAVTGALSEELSLALRVNGYWPVPVSAAAEIPATSVAVYVPGGDIAIATELVGRGFCVLTDADATDPNVVSQLLALGVADVVSRPVRAEQLTRKLDRAVRKSRRRRNR